MYFLSFYRENKKFLNFISVKPFETNGFFECVFNCLFLYLCFHNNNNYNKLPLFHKKIQEMLRNITKIASLKYRKLSNIFETKNNNF